MCWTAEAWWQGAVRMTLCSAGSATGFVISIGEHPRTSKSSQDCQPAGALLEWKTNASKFRDSLTRKGGGGPKSGGKGRLQERGHHLRGYRRDASRVGGISGTQPLAVNRLPSVTATTVRGRTFAEA